MCGLGVAVGCRMKHAKSALEGFHKALGEGCQVSSVLRVLSFSKGLERLAGFKGWQTAGLDAHKKPWMCGLGVPVGCRMKHAKGLLGRP